MATFNKNTGCGSEVVCTVPPSYSSNSVPEGKPYKRSVVILFGAVLITTIVVAGVVSMTHLLIKGSKNTGDNINIEYNKIQNVETMYTYHGVNKTQTMSMDRDSDTISLHNHEDNFDVILDYNRRLAIYKNLSSNTCYFTNLRDIPLSTVGADELWTVAPILFPEDGDGMNAMTMRVQTELPRDFVSKATDEKVGMMCSSGKSFWVESTGEPQEDTRVKRQLQSADSDSVSGLAYGCISGWCKVYYTDGTCSGWDWCKITVIGNYVEISI